MLLALTIMLTAQGALAGGAGRAAEAAAAGESAAMRAAIAAVAEGSDGAVYDAARDADADVAAALARAQANGRMTMIVLGGNWCHDSRALAEHFAEDDFASMLRQRYEVVYVDVGYRDRNLQIPARYGVAALTGTPTVLIVSPDGALLNRGTAATWRNAGSRSRQTIFAHFRNFGSRR